CNCRCSWWRNLTTRAPFPPFEESCVDVMPLSARKRVRTSGSIATSLQDFSAASTVNASATSSNGGTFSTSWAQGLDASALRMTQNTKAALQHHHACVAMAAGCHLEIRPFWAGRLRPSRSSFIWSLQRRLGNSTLHAPRRSRGSGRQLTHPGAPPVVHTACRLWVARARHGAARRLGL